MMNFSARYTSYRNGIRLMSAPWDFRATDFDDAVRCANLFLDGMRAAAHGAQLDLVSVWADPSVYHGDTIQEGGPTIWDDPAPVGSN